MNMETAERNTPKTKKYIDRTKYKSIILFLAIASSFVGHITVLDYLIATAWMIAALYLFNKDDFWVLFIPLSVFENTVFFYFTDYTIFKILLLLGVVKLAMSISSRTKILINRYTILFLLLAGYAILNLGDFLPGTVSLVICVITIFMMCFSSFKMRESEFFARAMFGYALFSVAAGIYGLLHGNSRVLTQNGIEMLRFCGTSADPNIMSYKFILGMIALLYTDFIKSKYLKIFLEIFLALMVFKTGSTTAIIALCITVAMSLLLQKPSLKKIITVSVSCFLIVFIVLNFDNFLVSLSKINFLNVPTTRLLEQYHSFVGGNVSEATSLRTDIWDGYMNYFRNEQGLAKQMFGGNVTNIYAIEKNFSSMSWAAAAHNTNIDILMCIGLVGLVLIYYIAIRALISDIKLYYESKEAIIAMRIITKAITVFYTFSISMFLSYGFMIFLI